MINLIRFGDDLDNGGRVTSASETMKLDGRRVARKGDKVHCVCEETSVYGSGSAAVWRKELLVLSSVCVYPAFQEMWVVESKGASAASAKKCRAKSDSVEVANSEHSWGRSNVVDKQLERHPKTVGT